MLFQDTLVLSALILPRSSGMDRVMISCMISRTAVHQKAIPIPNFVSAHP